MEIVSSTILKDQRTSVGCDQPVQEDCVDPTSRMAIKQPWFL